MTRFLYLICFLFPLVSFATAPAGLWQIDGHHSQRGDYHGEVEFRPEAGGTQVTRVITYQSYQFSGLRVQEVWQGRVNAQGVLQFQLKNSDYITAVDGFVRDPKLYNTTTDVSFSYLPSGPNFQTEFTTQGGHFQERLSQQKSLGAMPLWQDERRHLKAKGPKGVPLAVRAAMAFAKKRADFDSHPFVQKYQDRAEYKSETPYLVVDPTDFNFYRSHRDTLRVVNKPLDPISMTESLMRRNAYAPPLDEKANGLELDTQQYRINQYGILTYVSFNEQNQFVRQNRDGDAALWTGMYVGAQAMRYVSTKDPQALENMKRSLRGVFLLLNITDNKKDFARSVMPYKGNENLGSRWHRGTGIYSDMVWYDSGNNDMIRGVTHALLWAHLVLPENDPLRSDLAKSTLRLFDLDVVQKKKGNKAQALGLAALVFKDAGYKKAFRTIFNDPEVALSGYLVSSSFYWNGIADWSGVNLTTLGFINKITLADLLGENKIRDRLRERMMDMWVTYAPVRPAYLTIATYKYAFSEGARGDDFRKQFSDQDFRQRLDFAVWSLREFPYPRPLMNIQYDHSISPEWCLSPLPGMFWKAMKKEVPKADYFFESLYSYPAFEGAAISDKFMWKSLYFSYQGSISRNSTLSSIDYLYVYWLAKYAGLRYN